MTLPRSILACALAAAALSPAFADDVRFSYRADQLETPEKLEALVERIKHTAEQACRTEPVLPPHYGAARSACEAELISAIVDEIDDSRLYVAVREEPETETPKPDGERFATVD